MTGRLLAIATALALAGAVAAGASAATVELRVESATGPAIFAGPVATLPHAVDGGDGSGPHPCAGPVGGPPSATATGVLDDAMRAAGISWRGNWDPSFRDFFIDRIGPYTSAVPDSYWSLSVNGRISPGGCLARVADGDLVRFYFGPLFGAAPGPVAGTDEPAGNGGEGASGLNGDDPTPRRVRAIARRAARFLRDASGVGADWSRLALAVRRGRGLGGAAQRLLGGRLDRLGRDGSVDQDVNATALAALGLERRPAAAGRALDWLAGMQGGDGGFGYRPGVAADVDTTALVAWALARGGRPAELHRAGEFLRASQAASGGFPALPGGEANAQSTGLALVGLRLAGFGPRLRSPAGRTPLGYLAALARRDGSIAYTPGGSPTPTWTTAQALLGLTSAARLLGYSG